MTLAELSQHVADEIAAVPAGARKPPKTPGAQTTEGGQSFEVNGQTVELSAREMRICKDMSVNPEDYAANKARRESARVA